MGLAPPKKKTCDLCLIPPSSVPRLDASGGSSRPWNAPCWADPHLWVSLGGLPTASVGAGERDASALLECPGWDRSSSSVEGLPGPVAPWRSPPPSEAVLASPALSAIRYNSGGAGSPPLCALSHWHACGACFDGGASHTHPSCGNGRTIPSTCCGGDDLCSTPPLWDS